MRANFLAITLPVLAAAQSVDIASLESAANGAINSALEGAGSLASQFSANPAAASSYLASITANPTYQSALASITANPGYSSILASLTADPGFKSLLSHVSQIASTNPAAAGSEIVSFAGNAARTTGGSGSGNAGASTTSSGLGVAPTAGLAAAVIGVFGAAVLL